MSRILALAVLTLLASGCDSADDGPVVAGGYEGEVTAAFSDGTTIDFDIRLTLDEPDATGAFGGDLRMVRGPVGFADEYIGVGTVSGQVSGSSISVSGVTTRTETARSSGGGLQFEGTGTVDGGTIRLTSASLFDFSYAQSNPFAITLR